MHFLIEFFFLSDISVPVETGENAGNHQELSSSQLKLLKHKKSIIEKVMLLLFGTDFGRPPLLKLRLAISPFQAYKKDCRTFAAVVKVLIR